MGYLIKNLKEIVVGIKSFMEPSQRFEIINVVFAPPVSMQTNEFFLYMYMYIESLLLGEPLIPLRFYLR